jgi:hypothetical protein
MNGQRLGLTWVVRRNETYIAPLDLWYLWVLLGVKNPVLVPDSGKDSYINQAPRRFRLPLARKRARKFSFGLYHHHLSARGPSRLTAPYPQSSRSTSSARVISSRPEPHILPAHSSKNKQYPATGRMYSNRLTRGQPTN